MRDVQASRAKTQLSKILDEVERGESFLITRHGRPIAQIVPVTKRRQAEIDEAIANIKKLRSRIGKITVEEFSFPATRAIHYV